MTFPVPSYPRITTPYGKPGSWSGGVHGGADVACPIGTPVVAMWGGTVTGASWGSAYGTQVVIDHDRLPNGSPGLWCVYAHLSRSDVRAGQRVEAGQQIGLSGNSGRSTGPHLHVEVQRGAQWKSGNHVNPQPWIDAGVTAPPQPSGWRFPAGHKVYAKYLKWEGHKQNSDGVSDSISAWQEMLNRHKLVGGATLPVTGKWAEMTSDETIKCQSQHLPPADGSRESAFVGPKQFAHVKADVGAPYEWVESGGGGGPTPPPPPPPPLPPPTVQWFLAPSLAALRSEVNALWPGRDTSSDGTIGDTAHSTSKSEHNPVGHPHGPEFGTAGAVHAIDITAKGIDVGRLLKAVIGDHRVWYVIHNKKIWSKTYQWSERAYNGSNPHTTHVHISLAADDQVSAIRNENDRAKWVEDEAPPTEPEEPDDQVSWAEVSALLRSIADRIDNSPPKAP